MATPRSTCARLLPAITLCLLEKGSFGQIFAPSDSDHPHQVNPLTIVLICAAIIMLAMWAYSRHAYRSGIYKSEKLNRAKSANKVLVAILKNFSLQSVQDFYFRGIKQKVQPVTVEFRDLSTTIRGGTGLLKCITPEQDKVLLAGVTGKFHAHRMSAIMGPSGAGKTTFLNVLCGKTKTRGAWLVTGDVLVNGSKMDITGLKPVMGFVPQDDIVHETMTVRENIRFSAELRNAAGTSRTKLNLITEDVLQVLQLEAQQNVLVGNRTTGTGLSGGQRKRVNIGLELAASPTLLFLDEPTSGLDATSSLLLCEMLKRMAGLGMTIVMVIHQPRYSLFTLIDDVLLLGKGGRTAYVGPTNSAMEYLQGLGFCIPVNENPADWMMDVLSGHVAVENPRMPLDSIPEALFDEWERSSLSNTEPLASQYTLRRGRTTCDLDELEVIKRHVKDEWEKCCPDAGSMDHQGFQMLLHNCLGCEIRDTNIVSELLLRTTGNADADVVTQQQFVRYLLKFREANKRGAVNDRTDPDDSASDSDSEGSSSGSELVDATPNDLNRVQPGFCVHLRVVMRRGVLEWWRRMTVRMLFLSVIIFAAVFLGFFDAVIFDSPPWNPTVLLNTHISIALLVSVYSLTCFSRDQPMYWREASHGLNRFAFMTARMIVEMIDWLILAFFFTATYYCIVLPKLIFPVYMVPFVLVSFVASGWGYLVSCILPPILAPFTVAVLCFMVGGILGLPPKMDIFLSGSLLEFIADTVCFTRWSVPMDFLAYITRQPLNETALDPKSQWELDLYLKGYNHTGVWLLPCGYASQWWTGMVALLSMGFTLRLACYPALRFMNADKQV
mmetsp:Transcript_79444/g.219739  ORF Transcript_79444/g.219739 Transcript_79444/m.219739 type:complete len:837 (+) Transcript_79444:71-2581(+)